MWRRWVLYAVGFVVIMAFWLAFMVLTGPYGD
jgi:hypothetical protein